MMSSKRVALLVGCNYANTKYQLKGCINDVLSMREVLLTQFGYDAANIELLTDGSESLIKPTGANIKGALSLMINRAESGDVICFHFSGHGTMIPSKRHPHQQDEAIVPCDLNLITDVDFRELINQLPNKTSFTFLSDSCHSGGLIDKEKEQIGPHSIPTTINHAFPQHLHCPKSIPYTSLLKHLLSCTGLDSLDMSTHLLTLFGQDASLKFRLPESELDSMQRVRPDVGILLSGCQANETSADVRGKGPDGKPHGAFTDAMEKALKENAGTSLTNRELVETVRKGMIGDEGVKDQHPCLYCSDENAEKPFLLLPQPPKRKTLKGAS